MRRLALLVALYFLSGCQIEPTFCKPCLPGGCGFGLECTSGVCAPPGHPELCPSHRCGDSAPCGDGFECFEGRCRTPVDIGLGNRHACVLWPSGQVSCWGENLNGQAGPVEASFMPPALVPGITGATQLAVGTTYTCALLDTGRIACFGANDVGQLGAYLFRGGNEDLRSRFRPVEVFLEEDQQASALFAGDATACALVGGNRDLYCWGYGEQCALSTEIDHSTLPLKIADGPFELVAIGRRHVVAARGGRLFGFGANDIGQLGAFGETVCGVQDLGLDGVAAAAGGWSHTCYATREGAIRCLGGRANLEVVAGPGDERGFDAVRAGTLSCARKREGIVCWGHEGDGQLGTVRIGELAGRATLIEGTENAAAFAVSRGNGATNCLIRDGDGTYCWGNLSHGEAGVDPQTVMPPTKIVEGDFVEVAVGIDHACARELDGRVVCWGDDYYGAVGRGEGIPGAPPGEVPDIRAKRIVTGFHYTCAIDQEDAVWCWGRFDEPRNSGRFRGRVYNGPIYRRPVRIEGFSRPVVELVATPAFACAQDDEGRIACFGDNMLHYLTRERPWEVIEVPLPISLPIGSTLVAAGDRFACARLGDTVHCYGYTPEIGVETAVGPFVKMTAGAGFACLLRETGDVACWGRNDNGTIAAPPIARRDLTLIESLSGVREVKALHAHTCAVTNSGDTYCWGQDLADGRLGLPDAVNHPWPTRVPGLPSILSVGTGKHTTCAISHSGDVWCWGSDRRGGVTGRSRLSFTPQRVQGLFGPRDRD